MHRDKKANINTSSHNALQIQTAATYLQVLSVPVTNWSNQVKNNALLDTGSDSTLITSEPKQVNLKGISQKLEISNVISSAKSIPSKLVSFPVAPNHHP